MATVVMAVAGLTGSRRCGSRERSPPNPSHPRVPSRLRLHQRRLSSEPLILHRTRSPCDRAPRIARRGRMERTRRLVVVPERGILRRRPELVRVQWRRGEWRGVRVLRGDGRAREMWREGGGGGSGCVVWFGYRELREGLASGGCGLVHPRRRGRKRSTVAH